MARINRVNKARSEVKCDKCGNNLKGLPYVWLQFFKSSKQIRCMEHAFSRRETTRNEWALFIMDVEEATDESDLLSQLEDKLSEEQEKLENMEEYGLTGGMAFDTITERVEALETAISEAEEIESLDAMTMSDLEEHSQTDFEQFKEDNAECRLSGEETPSDDDEENAWMEFHGQDAWDTYFQEKRDEIVGEL